MMKGRCPDEKEMCEAFKAFDADGNGFISKEELKKAMINCGAKPNDKELDEMIKAADTDKDDKVNFEGN
jgi:Ca2+-binding EF-hand superfamily protein